MKKYRWYNGQKKKDKRDTTQKAKDWVTQTSLKSGCELGCSETVSSSCCTSDIRHVTVKWHEYHHVIWIQPQFFFFLPLFEFQTKTSHYYAIFEEQISSVRAKLIIYQRILPEKRRFHQGDITSSYNKTTKFLTQNGKSKHFVSRLISIFCQ